MIVRTIIGIRYLGALIALFFIMPDVSAQKARQEVELLTYNIGFGIVSTSIGALINKPKHQKGWTAIKKAWWQGAVGGALQYSGKKLTYQITRTSNYWWGWGSKLVHSAGSSICHNGAMNYRFGQYWVLDYAAFRFNFTIDRGKLDFTPQFNLLFLYDVGYLVNKGKIDWNKTLKMGALVVTASRDLKKFDGYKILGRAYSGSLIYRKNVENNVLAHEFVHVLQYNEYRVMNTYFNPLVSKIRNKTVKNLFKYINVELPYSTLFYQIAYNKNHYYRNPYEFEAEFFSTNSAVDR